MELIRESSVTIKLNPAEAELLRSLCGEIWGPSTDGQLHYVGKRALAIRHNLTTPLYNLLTKDRDASL